VNTEKSNDNVDKDIEALYVQRKKSIKAPNISFSETEQPKNYRVKSIFSILMLGTVASFGILAVITHFADLSNTQPEKNAASITFVDMIEVESFDEDNQTINIPSSPKEQKDKHLLAKLPTRGFEPNTQIEVRPQAAKAITLENAKVNIMPLVIDISADNIIQPTFKVMPKVTRNKTTYQSGSVTLTYKISKEGKVKNIKVMQSDVHRDLEKSAKKALTQWRYAQHSNADKELQVEFQFNGS